MFNTLAFVKIRPEQLLTSAAYPLLFQGTSTAYPLLIRRRSAWRIRRESLSLLPNFV